MRGRRREGRVGSSVGANPPGLLKADGHSKKPLLPPRPTRRPGLDIPTLSKVVVVSMSACAGALLRTAKKQVQRTAATGRYWGDLCFINFIHLEAMASNLQAMFHKDQRRIETGGYSVGILRIGISAIHPLLTRSMLGPSSQKQDVSTRTFQARSVV